MYRTVLIHVAFLSIFLTCIPLYNLYFNSYILSLSKLMIGLDSERVRKGRGGPGRKSKDWNQTGLKRPYFLQLVGHLQQSRKLQQEGLKTSNTRDFFASRYFFFTTMPQLRSIRTFLAYYSALSTLKYVSFSRKIQHFQYTLPTGLNQQFRRKCLSSTVVDKYVCSNCFF